MSYDRLGQLSLLQYIVFVKVCINGSLKLLRLLTRAYVAHKACALATDVDFPSEGRQKHERYRSFSKLT